MNEIIYLNSCYLLIDVKKYWMGIVNTFKPVDQVNSVKQQTQSLFYWSTVRVPVDQNNCSVLNSFKFNRIILKVFKPAKAVGDNDVHWNEWTVD